MRGNLAKDYRNKNKNCKTKKPTHLRHPSMREMGVLFVIVNISDKAVDAKAKEAIA